MQFEIVATVCAMNYAGLLSYIFIEKAFSKNFSVFLETLTFECF
jgi:hypothetical protein